MSDAARIAALEAQVRALLDVVEAQARALAAMRPPPPAAPGGESRRVRREFWPKPDHAWPSRPPGVELPPVEVTEIPEPELKLIDVPVPVVRRPLVRLKTAEERAQDDAKRQQEDELRRAEVTERIRRRSERWVYFIQVGEAGPIKIGITKDVKSRLSNLQCGHTEALRLLHHMAGTGTDEAALHERFHSLRISGEWFRPDPALLAQIEGLKAKAA